MEISYSDGARATIENVYKSCKEQKKSGMKLSLNRVCFFFFLHPVNQEPAITVDTGQYKLANNSF